MAISNTPPPQAYTREVLAQAFNWLKSQPANVRERALSADALVGLYLHAKRYGTGGGPTTPVVSPWDQDSDAGANSFKSDLKNLAQGFKEFEAQASENPVAVQTSHQAMATTQTVHQQQTVTTTQVKAQSLVSSFVQELDPKTLEILREVQSRLNLSSEQEALRMLVLLGNEKVRTLLPP